MIEIINQYPKFSFWMDSGLSTSHISAEICIQTGFLQDDFYLLLNGKRLNTISNDTINDSCKIYVVQRTVGGKGGFGSMLRAIGAQIEKTTNREACRDLSGRRLRDINEEKRLKNWIDQQAEREQTAADKKKKKLERLCQQPKHEFKDEVYDKERSALPEKVEDALEQGLQASTSGAEKRKLEPENGAKKKKPKLWLDDDIELSSEEDLSGEEEDKEEEEKTEICKETSQKQPSKEKEADKSDSEQQEENIPEKTQATNAT